MSETTELASDLAAAHHEVLGLIDSCSDEQWRTATDDEGWPVGVVFNHIADGSGAFQGWIGQHLRKEPVVQDMDAINAGTAQRVAGPAGRTREETRRRVEDAGNALSDLIAGLSDEQLYAPLPSAPADGREVTAARLGRRALRHTRGHHQSCRVALGLSPEGGA